MFADPHTLYEHVLSGADVTQPFTLLQLATGSSVRKNLARPTAEHPLIMKMSHNLVGKGSQQRKRSVVRFDTPLVVNSVEVPGMASSCYVVLDVPVLDVSNAHTYLWRSVIGCLKGDSDGVGSTANFWNRWKAGEV